MPTKNPIPVYQIRDLVRYGDDGLLRHLAASEISTPSPCISQVPFLTGTASLPVSSPEASWCKTGAACDEMAPGARMPGLLNRLSLDRELSLEGSGFDGLSKRELS
jgi:hypothetical protein